MSQLLVNFSRLAWMSLLTLVLLTIKIQAQEVSTLKVEPVSVFQRSALLSQLASDSYFRNHYTDASTAAQRVFGLQNDSSGFISALTRFHCATPKGRTHAICEISFRNFDVQTGAVLGPDISIQGNVDFYSSGIPQFVY